MKKHRIATLDQVVLIALAIIWSRNSLGQGVPQPGLKSSLVSTNFQVSITNAVSTAVYELYWIPELNSTTYKWKWLMVGSQGQSNFVMDISSTAYGFLVGKVGTDSDNDGVVDWQDSRPNDSSAGLLSITIETPANNSTID